MTKKKQAKASPPMPLAKDKEPQEWLNPTQAAEYLGISRQSLYKLMDKGALPFQSVKGIQKRRLRKADLDQLLALPPS